MAQEYGRLVKDSAILELINHNAGHQLKQGDQTVLKYEIIDRDEEPLDLVGAPAKAIFMNRGEIIYEATTEVTRDNYVYFHIDRILPARKYKLEIVVDGKYVFPSDQQAELEIVESSIGIVSGLLEQTPFDVVAELIKQETADMAIEATHYIHTQDVESDEWVINHRMNAYPVVDVLDDLGRVVYGEVINMSRNQTVIRFTKPVKGLAVLK